MTREGLDNGIRRAIFALVVAILVFGPLATGAVRTLEFLVIQWLTVGALTLWLLRFWVNPEYRLLWPPVCWAVLAFLGYAILRYRLADIEYVARGELIRVMTYAILFFIILNNLLRQESAQTLSLILVFLAMAISIYAVIQFATNSSRVWHFLRPLEYRARGSGTYICPNHLAGFLEMVLPLGLAFTLTGRLKPLIRIMVGYASLVIITGIIVTVSKGGWISTGLSLLVFFFVLVRKRGFRIPALLVMLALVAGTMVFLHGSERSQRRFEQALGGGENGDASIRLGIWESAVRLWREHPWLGVGPGHFDQRFPVERPRHIQVRPGHVHNDYLDTLTEWGVVGFMIVGAAVTIVLLGVRRTWKYTSREENPLGAGFSNRTALVLGASIGLVAILIHSLFDFNMHIPANAILAVTLMAMLSGSLRFASERYWLRWGVAGRVLATLIGFSGIAYLGMQGTRKAQEYYWFSRARAETDPGPKLAALKRAATVEPSNFDTTYAIGESLRQLSWLGEPGFGNLAAEAIEWFQRGVRLNPYDAYNHLRIGMCLDWLNRHDEAAPSYRKSLELDPYNFYLLAHQGWHFVQVEDYPQAKFWFGRSWSVNWWDNPIAANYLLIVDRKLKEKLKENPPPTR